MGHGERQAETGIYGRSANLYGFRSTYTTRRPSREAPNTRFATTDPFLLPFRVFNRVDQGRRRRLLGGGVGRHPDVRQCPSRCRTDGSDPKVRKHHA